MPNDLNSLLYDPILSIATKASAEPRWCTLPEALALVIQDELTAWLGLQPHQHQPWHCFLAQLGALAYAKMGWSQWPKEAQPWQEALLTLTRQQPEAWALVVEDPSKPAFMQPPIPEGSLEKAGYLKRTDTPDEVDILSTAKNLDIKIRKSIAPRAEQWIFSLVTLQTMQGFYGQGNYGIARMNGGYGSRPMISITPSLSTSKWLIRDMNVLQKNNQKSNYEFDLIWIEPWNGTSKNSIQLHQCHPYFIEVCRRIRIKKIKNITTCLRTTSESKRITPPENYKGKTDDPWAPTLSGKLLTVSEQGFHYKLVSDLINDTDAICSNYHKDFDSNTPLLVCTCLVRGEGGTGGFHQRIIPIRASAIPKIFGRKPDAPSPVHALSTLQIEQAKICIQKALRPALLTLAHGGESQHSTTTPALVSRGQDHFEQLVDEHFFTALWDGLEHGQEAHRIFWQEKLIGWAKQSLEHSIHNSPLPLMRTYKAIANATSMLHGCLRKQFPDYYASLKLSHTQEQSA